MLLHPHDTTQINSSQYFAGQFNPQQTQSSRNFKKLYWQRLLTENILVFLLQYCGLLFSTFTLFPFPIWFASGTSCAFIFLRGYSILFGVWLGSLFAFYLLKIPSWLAIASATIFTLQNFLLFFGSIFFISPTLLFIRRGKLIQFICYAALITGLASCALILLYHSLLTYRVIKIGLQWWLANFNGVLVLSFSLIAWDAFFPQIKDLTLLNKKKCLLLFGLLSLFLTASLFITTPFVMMGCAGFVMLSMIMISVNYGWCGAIISILLLTLTMILSLLSNASSSHFVLINQLFLSIAILLTTMSSLSQNPA